MPKVKPLIKEDKRAIEMRGKLYGILAKTRMNQHDVAKSLGVTYSTLNRHIRNVADMRLREVWAIEDLERRIE